MLATCLRYPNVLFTCRGTNRRFPTAVEAPMNRGRWLFALGLVVTLSGNSYSERVRGVEFDDPDYELVGWLAYKSEGPLLHPPFKLPNGDVPFEYPARLETRLDEDGKQRVILSFAADLKLKNKKLRLVGWDKNNKIIPRTASKVQKVPGKDVLLINAELLSTRRLTEMRRLVLMSAIED